MQQFAERFLLAVGHNNRKQIVAIAECRACQTLRSAEEGNFAQAVAASESVRIDCCDRSRDNDLFESITIAEGITANAAESVGQLHLLSYCGV